MRITTTFLAFLLFASCATGTGKEKNYTGSTPAGPVIRSVLGIPLADSVDFIRWQISIGNDQYHLNANYGIAKPNTNGFINGGVKIELSGKLKKENNYWYLENSGKTLKIIELNENLLHFLDADKNMMAGNGGWSYTLSNVTHSVTDKVTVAAKQTAVKDSMSFEGRTPCNVPGLFAPGTLCYKLKWYIVLYGRNNEPAGFRILGTRWRKENGITGNWEIVPAKNGGVIYQLNYGLSDGKGSGILYLMKLDERVLIFADAEGKLLVGDEDFSYTLNRFF